MPSKSALLEQEKALQERLKSASHDSSSDDDDNDDSEDEEEDLKALKDQVVKSQQKSQSRNHSTSFSRRLRKSPGNTVLYLGHVPRELGEKELAHFLKQFGRVVNVRVSRSKRTGNSRGYAFFQMANENTARIVADTLSGYILMGQRRLVCHVVPPEKVHSNLFFKASDGSTKQPKETSQPVRSLQKIKVVTKKLVQRERKRKALLKAAGIDYDFPGYEAGQNAMEGSDEQGKDEAEEETPVQKNSQKKRKDSVDESSGKKKRKESLDEPSFGNKKRADSVDSATKKKRSESVDSATKKKRSESVDSATKKVRSDSVDSATKSSKKKKRKESIEAEKLENDNAATPMSTKKRSEPMDSSSGKHKKRSESVDSSSKKKRSESTDSSGSKKKKRHEESEHEESPQAKKRRDSVDSDKLESAEKTPHKSKKSKKKRSK